MNSNKRQAIHEAGHAVIAVLLGGKVDSVTIGPRGSGEALIKAFYEPSASLIKSAGEVYDAERELQVGMAGALAEAVHFGEPVKEAVDREVDDLLMVLEVAGDLHEDDEVVGRHLLKAGRRVLNLYEDPGVWKAVQTVAAKLASFGHMSGRKVHRIVRRHVPVGSETPEKPSPGPVAIFTVPAL